MLTNQQVKPPEVCFTARWVTYNMIIHKSVRLTKFFSLFLWVIFASWIWTPNLDPLT
jgi:hypothetical protein